MLQSHTSLTKFSLFLKLLSVLKRDQNKTMLASFIIINILDTRGEESVNRKQEYSSFLKEVIE